MAGRHYIRAHRWVNGVLHSWIERFETMGDAVSYAGGANASSVKVYNEQGTLVHHQQHSQHVELYAG